MPLQRYCAAALSSRPADRPRRRNAGPLASRAANPCRSSTGSAIGLLARIGRRHGLSSPDRSRPTSLCEPAFVVGEFDALLTRTWRDQGLLLFTTDGAAYVPPTS